MPHSITLQTGSGTVTDGMVLGSLAFAASSEADGTDGVARNVTAKIEAVAEEAFTDTDNATEMVFYLAAGGAAASKMTLSSAGLLTSAGGITSTAAANTFGSTSFSDANITNVGSLACDSMVVDTAADGLDIVFGGVTTTNKITLTDSLADALNITEGSNSYMKFMTTGGSEKIIVSKTIYSATDGDITIKAEGSMVFQVDADGSAATDTFQWLKGNGDERMHLTEGGDLQLSNGELQTAKVAYRDGDRAITIADGGACTFPQVATFSKATIFSKATKQTLKSNTDDATVEFDLDEANVHTVELGAGSGAGNRTFSITNADDGQKFIIRMLQDGIGSRTVTWFSTIKWAGGSAPTLTTTPGEADVVGFLVTGTDTYDGFVIGQNI